MTDQFQEDICKLREICIDIKALANLLDAWAEKEYLIEISMILEKMKPRVEEFENILEKYN